VTSYELWTFVHIAAAMVWIGGAVVGQVFGVLAKRSGDPARSAGFGKDMAFVGPTSSCRRRSSCWSPARS
jgi:hypothetical protein